jgi:hypothetical protein
MASLPTPVLVLVALLLLRAGSFPASAWPDCSPELDGHVPFNGTAASAGAFGPVARVNASWLGVPLVALVPTRNASAAGSDNAAFPLLVFMHGSTAQWEMYSDNLQRIAAHGFVVVPVVVGASCGWESVREHYFFVRQPAAPATEHPHESIHER